MTAFALAFAGFQLEGFHEWNERAPSRVTETNFARRPGSIAPRVPTPDSRRINLVGDIWADDTTVLENYLQDLRHNLNELGRDRLTRLDTGQFLNVVKADLQIAFLARELPHLHAKCNIDFLADDPFWYYSESSTQTDNLTGTSDDFTVDNNGKAKTPPIFELIRSAGSDLANVVLTQTTTGQFLQWNGTFAVGKKLIFDCKNSRVIYDGADALNNFTPGSINMQLVFGQNNFTYVGPGNMSITTIWHEREH